MVLVDKRILLGGIAMIAVGISLSLYIVSISPVGKSGMSEEEKLDLILHQRENQDYNTLAGIMIGIGFMLVLISFGARRRKPSGIQKTEKKPAQ